jgi:hypothetical protein
VINLFRAVFANDIPSLLGRSLRAGRPRHLRIQGPGWKPRPSFSRERVGGGVPRTQRRKDGGLDRGSSEAGQGSKGSYGSHRPRCLPPLAPSNLTHGPSAPRCCSQSHLFRLSPLPASLTGLPPTHRWGPSIPDAYHTLPYHPTTPGLPSCILAFAWRVYFNGQPPLPHGPRPHPLPPQGPS